MVESSVTEGRKTLKSQIKLNKRLHYTPLVSVNSTPTSPFYTVLYANQVPTFRKSYSAGPASFLIDPGKAKENS